jgi:hypothetical protein
MSPRGVIAAAAKAGGYSSALPGERQIRAALADPRREQEGILRRYLTRNADTDFGRRFRFDQVRTVAEFQRRVPLHDYDAIAGDIDRIAAGESRVLTAEPVRRLATSSGSTRARKLIPYTAELQREFDRAIGPWIVDLFRRDRSLMRGCAYWSITPSAPVPANGHGGGPPVGFEEDSAYLGGVRKRLIDMVMAVPGDVRHVTDATAFRRATLAHLRRRRDLRLISVWHPSFLELLLDAAGDDFDWRAHWPNLRLVSCWADAHAAAPAAALARRLEGVRIQPKGLLATEAFATVPYAGATPVAVRSHFFEFLDGDAVRLIDELQPGRIYSVVVTTAGGLWRYRLHDRVRVEGFVERTASLRFVGREDGVSDHFGEKLSEGFVGNVIREVLALAGVDARFSMLAPDASGDAFRYVLFIEPSVEPPRDLAARLDAALRANPHYDHCRALGQLGPARVFVIRDGGFEQYAAELTRTGRRLGDIKPTPLCRRTAVWTSAFQGSWAR